MNLVLEPRHWILMVGAVLIGALAFWGLPQILSIYPLTLYAIPLLAVAVILDTLGNASEGRRAPWKIAAWTCLAGAALPALWPLQAALQALSETYRSWAAAGVPLPRSVWETFKGFGRFPEEHQEAVLIGGGVGLVVMALAIITPLRAAFDPRFRRNRQSRSGPWRAGWMEPRDIARLARNKTGMPLALYNGKLLRYAKDDAKGWRGGHHLVVAGTRGGKGVGAVIPAILDHQGPVVVLDIKGENFAVTRRHRQSLGRQVVVLNPFGVIEDSADQVNPLDYIRPHELSRDIPLLADGLVRPEKGDGAHFAEMARELVTGAIEVVVTQEEPEHRTLVRVADLLLAPDLDNTLQAWAENADLVGHRPAQIAATILRAGDRERGSIQTSVAKAFAWMQSDAMRHFLKRSSFRMEDLLDDRIDLFVAVPLDQIDKQAVFMRLFINLVLGLVVRQDGRRKVKAPILLALDEFVRMGRMEQIMNIANVAAGVGFEALFVTQDTGQVVEAYGQNDARSIFGSCITKRLFNLNDIETADWAARHLGEGTIYSQQIKEDRSLTSRGDLSYAEQRQKLMTAEQILGMKPDELLLLVGNRSPLRAKLNIYFKSKAYEGKSDRNPLTRNSTNRSWRQKA